MENYVERREGGYYIVGMRISLDSIVHAFQDGESPEGILRSFPMAGPLVRIGPHIRRHRVLSRKQERGRGVLEGSRSALERTAKHAGGAA